MKTLLPIAFLLLSITGCKKSSPKDITYTINGTTSKVEWKGSAPDHFHIGSFKLTGSLNTNSKGMINSGEFNIPISSIENYDLENPQKQALLDDLLSDHFFNVLVHPNAKFRITEVRAYTTAVEGAVEGANYMITGDFSMLGKTNSITFPAKITSAAETLITEAKFKINRTRWGMNIYTDPAAPLYILPDININLSIQSSKTAD